MFELSASMFQATLLVVAFVVLVLVSLIGAYLTVITFHEVYKALKPLRNQKDIRNA